MTYTKAGRTVKSGYAGTLTRAANRGDFASKKKYDPWKTVKDKRAKGR